MGFLGLSLPEHQHAGTLLMRATCLELSLFAIAHPALLQLKILFGWHSVKARFGCYSCPLICHACPHLEASMFLFPSGAVFYEMTVVVFLWCRGSEKSDCAVAAPDIRF